MRAELNVTCVTTNPDILPPFTPSNSDMRGAAERTTTVCPRMLYLEEGEGRGRGGRVGLEGGGLRTFVVNKKLKMKMCFLTFQ